MVVYASWSMGAATRDVRTHPISLEAILGAKIAVFDSQLQARGTLEAPRIIVAVITHALAAGCRLGPHGDWSKKRD